MPPAKAPRRVAAWLRTPQGVVLAACLAVVFAMFATNTDWGGDPVSPRGDGKYRPVLARGDGHLMYLMTRSLVLDGDLVWDNDLAAFGDPFNASRTATGRKMIPHPIGPPLVHAPFFALAHGLSKVCNLFGADIPSHGYTMFHQRIVFATSVVFAWAAVLLGFLVARRWVGGRWAPLYGAVAVLFGTPLTYYATYMPSYAHAMDAAAGAGFVAFWALGFGATRWRRFVVLGLLIGVCALIRVTGFAWGIAVAVELVALFFRPPPELQALPRARRALALGARGAVALAVAIAAFTPQMLAWKVVFGQWLTSPMGPEFVRLGHPQIVESLFSSRNGWLSTHPIAYSGLVGLVLVPRRARVVALGLALVVVAVVWINSAAGDWWGGAAFGARRLSSLTAVLVVGVAALVRAAGLAARRLPRWAAHGLALTALGWFLWWNLVQVDSLRRGRPANGERRGCCRYVAPFQRALAQPIYDRIGDPFALPASALFGLRYGIPWRTWDMAVGRWADSPDLRELNDGTYVARTPVWDLGAPDVAPWIASGFGPPQTANGRGFRWTIAAKARALVPLWLPDAREISIAVVPNLSPGDPPLRIRARWNGELRFDSELGAGEGQIRFQVPSHLVHVGMNDIVLESEPRPLATSLRPGEPSGVAVGLAVGALRMRFGGTN